MNNVLKVAVLLTAVDQMSNTVQSAVNKSKASLGGLNGLVGKIGSTAGAGIAAQASIDLFERSIQSYATLQQAQLDLKSSLLKEGNNLNTEDFEKLNKLAVELGNKLPGSTEDFERMFTVMIKSGGDATKILNGAGRAAAYVAVATDQEYSSMARSVLKFQRAMGIADKDLIAFMDIISRTKNADVDIQEMEYAFARSAGQLKILNLQGLEASKSVSALYTMLIQTGQSGETVGTGFATMTNSLLNKDKITEFNDALAKYRIHMNFIDKEGKFTIENMVSQLSKLNKIKNIEEKEALLKILFGGGTDQNMASIISVQGIQGYNKVIQNAKEQATMMDKGAVKLSSQISKYEAFSGTTTNIFATLGQSVKGETDALLDHLNNFSSKTQEWLARHPFASKLITTALISPTAVGNLLFDKYLTKPFKSVLNEIVDTAKVYGQAFYHVGHSLVKSFGRGFRNTGWFLTELYEAGKRMMMFFANGIGEGWKYVATKISDLTTKVREYFPFSPAKRGALRDIHKVRLMETIANTIKPNSVINAVNHATNSIAGRMPMLSPSYASGAHSGSPVSVVYSPTIYLGAGANKDDFGSVLRNHKDEIVRIIEDSIRNQQRTKLF